jgi:RecJ-like exonuclease
MHGANEGCDGYFCATHLSAYLADNLTGSIYGGRVCQACHAAFEIENGKICDVCDGDGRVGMGGTDVCEACDGTGLDTSVNRAEDQADD